MVGDKSVISRPNMARCYLALLFPFITIIPFYLLTYLPGFSMDQYHERIVNSHPLLAKSVINGVFGVLGLILWVYVMAIPSVLALYYRNNYLSVVDGNLIFCGRNICRMVDIRNAFLKKSGLRMFLFVVTVEGRAQNVGDIAMCQDAETAVAEIRKLGR